MRIKSLIKYSFLSFSLVVGLSTTFLLSSCGNNAVNKYAELTEGKDVIIESSSDLKELNLITKKHLGFAPSELTKEEFNTKYASKNFVNSYWDTIYWLTNYFIEDTTSFKFKNLKLSTWNKDTSFYNKFNIDLSYEVDNEQKNIKEECLINANYLILEAQNNKIIPALECTSDKAFYPVYEKMNQMTSFASWVFSKTLIVS